MESSKHFVTYEAICEDKGGKVFSVWVFSNGEILGPHLPNGRLQLDVNPSIEQHVKTAIINLYHPKTISINKFLHNSAVRFGVNSRASSKIPDL